MMKYILSALAILILFSGNVMARNPMALQGGTASYGVGLSYQVRDSDPSRGFGVHLERSILSMIPVLDINLVAHFSYFNEEVATYRDVQAPADLDAYDFGLGANGGISFGLFKPYAGVGLGSDNFEAVRAGAEELDVSEDSMYWNISGGVRIPILPVVKPFVEYRFTRLMGSDDFDYTQNSRVAIGIIMEL